MLPIANDVGMNLIHGMFQATNLKADMQELYSTARVCANGEERKAKCMALDPGIYIVPFIQYSSFHSCSCFVSTLIRSILP